MSKHLRTFLTLILVVSLMCLISSSFYFHVKSHNHLRVVNIDRLRNEQSYESDTLDDVKLPEPDHHQPEQQAELTDSREIIKQLNELGLMGRLNYDVWHSIIGYTVDDMRIKREYPSQPDDRNTIETLHVEFNEVDPQDFKGRYAHKIYGYLLPSEPGDYRFSIEMSELTAAGCVELWLSTDDEPLNMHKILVLDYDDRDRPNPRKATYKRAESDAVKLTNVAHYFEFIEKAFDGKMIVDVMWKPPSVDDFKEIHSGKMAMASSFDQHGKFTVGPALASLNGPLPSNELQSHHRVTFAGGDFYPYADIRVLPECTVTLAYTKPRKVKTDKEIHESSVYPKDETWYKNWRKDEKGNAVIKKETVDQLLSLYKKALEASSEYEGDLITLHYLESTDNKELRTKKVHGTRFLLELDIELTKPEKKLIHTSEYVYITKDKTDLCHLSNFQWKKEPVDVYFILALKNQASWVHHLIENMEDIYSETKDDHFELVVVDYESDDIDIEAVLRNSSIKRWKCIKRSGPFSRAGGVQAGIDYVKDPNSIIMTFDLHLTTPSSFLHSIRKHTIQGKMVYSPLVFRLNTGYTELNYNGFYAVWGYGLSAMFKSDWTTVGGYDTATFTDKWGGEDVNLIKYRVLAKGYEVFRLRFPGLVHYHHSNAGMWGGNNKDRPNV